MGGERSEPAGLLSGPFSPGQLCILSYLNLSPKLQSSQHRRKKAWQLTRRFVGVGPEVTGRPRMSHMTPPNCTCLFKVVIPAAEEKLRKSSISCVFLSRRAESSPETSGVLVNPQLLALRQTRGRREVLVGSGCRLLQRESPAASDFRHGLAGSSAGREAGSTPSYSIAFPQL